MFVFWVMLNLDLHFTHCVCILGDAMAVIKLDHQQVIQTPWKPHSQQCWDYRASIDLDRVSIVI